MYLLYWRLYWEFFWLFFCGGCVVLFLCVWCWIFCGCYFDCECVWVGCWLYWVGCCWDVLLGSCVCSLCLELGWGLSCFWWGVVWCCWFCSRVEDGVWCWWRWMYCWFWVYCRILLWSGLLVCCGEWFCWGVWLCVWFWSWCWCLCVDLCGCCVFVMLLVDCGLWCLLGWCWGFFCLVEFSWRSCCWLIWVCGCVLLVGMVGSLVLSVVGLMFELDVFGVEFFGCGWCVGGCWCCDVVGLEWRGCCCDGDLVWGWWWWGSCC